MTMDCVIYLRFSSRQQENGDSLERQKRVCEGHANLKGWNVIETISDLGRSAWKGHHLSVGNLGGFTRRVEAGEIERGTIILAEKLDRFARLPRGDTQAWWRKITTAGVMIALVDPDRLYSSESSLLDDIELLLRAELAWQESQQKSDRVLSAKRRMWGQAERREGNWTNAANRHPHWLKPTVERNGWLIDQERVRIITKIYEWSADGLGAQLIARRLNEAGDKPFGIWRKHSHEWSLSPINEVLRNRAVEGDLAPGAGIFKGQVIHGFFPRVVDADLVARARSGKAERAKVRGARVSPNFTSLFTAVCGECGGPAHLTSNFSQKTGRRYPYLRCELAREQRGCTNTGYYPYYKFEPAALDLVLDLALDDRFFAATTELRDLRVKRAELTKTINDLTVQRDGWLTLYKPGDTQTAGRINESWDRLTDLKASGTQLDVAIAMASGQVEAAEHISRVNDIREAAASPDLNVREQARGRLKRAIRTIVHGLHVERVDGQKVFTLMLMAGVIAVRFNDKGEVIDAVQGHLPTAQTEGGVLIEPLLQRLKSSAPGSVMRQLWLRLERNA
jgi:DNA invertase Pin-like site-specific DNA recombinase